MALDVRRGIDLRSLDALHDNDYLYAQKGSQGRIHTSSRPLKESYFLFSRGTSHKHRLAFERLSRAVKRQYGFELQADRPGGTRITVGSLKAQIRAAQQKNREAYQQLLQGIGVKYGPEGNFGQRQILFASRQIRDDFQDGLALTGARRAKLENQLAIRDFARTLGQRFGGNTYRTILDDPAIQDKLDNGQALTRADKERWQSRFSAEKGLAGLAGRIRAGLGDAAAQAATDRLRERIDGLSGGPGNVPGVIHEKGRLPLSWADDALDAALDARLAEIENDEALNAAQRADAAALARGRTEALKSRQVRLAGLELAIAGSRADVAMSPHPSALFAPGAHTGGGDVYRLCDDLASIDRLAAGDRLRQWRGDDAHVRQRLREAQKIAGLGLQLRQANIPAAEAAYLLHMEATLRAQGHGPAEADQWSPMLANRQDARALAQLALGLETNGQPNLDRSTIGKLMELELAERAAGRGANDFQTWSPATAALLQDRQGLALLADHAMPLAAFGALRSGGARTAREALECHRLGVPPEALHQDKTDSTRALFQTWADAGFSEAETQAYLMHFDNPAEIREFRGSLLKPDEIRLYRRKGIPLSSATRLGRFTDTNRLGDISRLGSGAFNTVYAVRYRGSDPSAEPEERVFKPEQEALIEAPGSLGKATLRNCVASNLDQRLGFDVLARTEVSVLDNHIGLSMERAPGMEAITYQVGHRHQEVVTADSRYAALLRPNIKNRIANDSGLRESLCKRYRLSAIGVNRSGDVVVMPAVLRQNKANPELQRQLVSLQLMDALIGNRDRHMSNYLVHIDDDTGRVKVTGIDNDDAFNGKITDPKQFAKHNTKVQLPPVVDRQQYDAMMGLTDQQLNQDLRHLSSKERGAAVSRLHVIKAHLQQLEDTGYVIEPDAPDGWGSRAITETFGAANSYVGRDCAIFQPRPGKDAKPEDLLFR
jgi:hypothetical protein